MIRSRVGEDPGASTLGNAMALIRVLVNVVVFAIALIVILDNLGVNVTALVAGLGIGGIAIGLAAQGIFSDLFAALVDRVRQAVPPRRHRSATEPAPTSRSARSSGSASRPPACAASTGEQVIMANTKLLEQEVRNLAEAKVRRVFLPFSLTYQTSRRDARAAARDRRGSAEGRQDRQAGPLRRHRLRAKLDRLRAGL